MKNVALALGPVLSFRGIGEGGIWKITALVGCPDGATPPALHVDGRQAAPPRVLHRAAKQSFLRYDLSCAMHDAERKVDYGIVDGPSWTFTVPAAKQAPRVAYVSCNGFSDPRGMRKLVRRASAVWQDLLANHDSALREPGYLLDKEQLWHEELIHDQGLQRFHILAMGGDQIYFDSIWEDVKELKRWVALSRAEQLDYKVTPALERQIENYYFSLYSQRWLPEKRRPWTDAAPNLDSADAMARIPTLMMWDDHDIFDGWGSYSCEMQHSPLFQTLFRHARRAFWVFQLQHALEDLPELGQQRRGNVSKNDPLYDPVRWSTALAHDGLALPLLDDQPGFSSVFHLGAMSLVVADLRTERSRTQVLGPHTWQALRKWLAAVKVDEGDASRPPCQHLLFLSSVPVIHPKLTLFEGLLDGLGQDHVLDSNADDLKDHWSHDDHEGERKRLLEVLTRVAEQCRLRVSIVSGDVHVAAWGTAYRKDIPPTSNWAQIQQFTSSAVVHPSLTGALERVFLHVLNAAAGKAQAIDIQHEVRMMLFPGHNSYIKPARNWLALELDGRADRTACKLWASWRCESEKGFSNHIQTVEPARA